MYLYEFSAMNQGGCEVQYYDTAESKIGSDDHALLMQMQQVDLDEDWAPRYSCSDDLPQWFKFDGKWYLETHRAGGANPKSELAEYWWIDIVEGDQARRACEAKYGHLGSKLVGVWIGTGWTSP